VSGAAASRTLALALLLLPPAAPLLVAADGGIGNTPQSTPSYILVGFVGGFVRHTNPTTVP